MPHARSTSVLVLVAFASFVTACSEGSNPLTTARANGAGRDSGGSGGSGPGDPSSGNAGGSSSGGAPTATDGGLAGSNGGADAGFPPPSLPPEPNGFQETIAPLLDAQGCTECHHKGRAIDLTTYPFMAGARSDAAKRLVAAFTNGMPPAPRTAAPQTVIDQVNAWVTAGMKP